MKRPRTFQVGVCVENASKHSIVVDLIVMQNVQLPINQTQPRPLGPPPPFRVIILLYIDFKTYLTVLWPTKFVSYLL